MYTQFLIFLVYLSQFLLSLLFHFVEDDLESRVDVLEGGVRIVVQPVDLIVHNLICII